MRHELRGGIVMLEWASLLGIGLVVAAASVYLVYVLEILKFRRLDAIRLRRLRPDVSPAEIDMDVAKHLETGEFEAVSHAGESEVHVREGVVDVGVEQCVSQRQVDQNGVRTSEERGSAQAPIAADSS